MKHQEGCECNQCLPPEPEPFVTFQHRIAENGYEYAPTAIKYVTGFGWRVIVNNVSRPDLGSASFRALHWLDFPTVSGSKRSVPS